MPKFQGVSGQVYYRHWAAAAPMAKMVFLHGYGEHTGLYHRFGDYMASRGVDVFALDAVGHGLTDGARGVPGPIEGLRRNVQFLGEIAQRQGPSLPIVLVGHSMGAATAASVLIQDSALYVGAVLCGVPLEELTTAQLEQLPTAVMSRDPFYLDELENDPLKFDAAATFPNVARTLDDARAYLQDRLPSVRLPILFMSGDNDVFCAPETTRHWAERLPKARSVIVSDTYHDLLNDVKHEEIASEILSHVRRCIGAA